MAYCDELPFRILSCCYIYMNNETMNIIYSDIEIMNLLHFLEYVTLLIKQAKEKLHENDRKS